MNERQRLRVAILVAAVAVVSVTVVLRLYQLQIVRHERYAARAESQHVFEIPVPATRGSILDRHGRVLAMSRQGHSLYAHPREVADPAKVASRLAEIVDVPEAELLARLRQDADFVFLDRFVDDEERRRILEAGITENAESPIWFNDGSKRAYPHDRLAVHVIGFAGVDGEGIEGIELAMDEALGGDATLMRYLRLGRGERIRHSVEPPERESEDVVLTIDLDLQHLVETELDRAVRETRARWATAILLDAGTGEVLALANRPTASLSRYERSTLEQRRNRAVTDYYEPGSTFKIVTMSAAIERDLIGERELFDCENGLYVDEHGRRIRDVARRRYLTPQGILENSSNIGISKIARRMTDRQLHDTIRAFGFSQRSGIELPGEIFGSLKPVEEWSGYTHTSLSFGQEVGVTPLQMAAAFGVLASGGVHVPPRIVLATRGSDGEWRRAPRPQPQRVLSPATTDTMRRMLESVVANGSGRRANVDGYRIAGKTGTAQKKTEGTGRGYSTDRHVASFAGFGPVDDPRLVGLVVLETDWGDELHGGRVAAPVFGRVMRHALEHLRVPGNRTVRVASLAGEPATPAAVRERVPASDPAGVVPDLRGASLRDAVSRLSRLGARVRTTGTGRVVAQSPRPGSRLTPGSVCSLRLAAEAVR